MEQGDWRDRASCLTADPELFFPVGEKSPADVEQIRQAKAICAKCLAQMACLEYALDTNQDSGIWGGTTEDERKDMKRRAHRRRLAFAQEN